MPAVLPPGLPRRCGALLYDALLLMAIWFIATALLLPLHGGQAIAPGEPAYSFYLLMVSFTFFGWCWTHGGQTLGMRAWKIRLRSVGGGEVGWLQALVRFLAALVSLGLFGLGYWWSLWDHEKCSWHDRISRTRIGWQALDR